MGRTCLLPMLAVASGCHIVFPIEPLGDDDGGAGSAPNVFSSPGAATLPPLVPMPGAPALWGGYPGSFSITLAADKPGTTIYYTTDASAPSVDSMTTMSSTTPIKGITISATSTVQYFGVQNGGTSATVTETLTLNPTSARMNAGYLVTNTTLDGTSPVVIASGGSTLAARASVQVWVQSDCAACKAQVVYGVDLQDQACLYDGNPNVFPGVTMANKTFNVTVPNTPGLHEVRISHIEETDCNAAKAAMTLKNRPTDSRIGVIVVP